MTRPVLINCRDHFDQKVEASLRRDLPIITTPHARSHLTDKGADSFTNVTAVDPFKSVMVDIGGLTTPECSSIRITGMPGKHVPSNSVIESLNSIVHAVSAYTFPEIYVISTTNESIRSHQRMGGCSNWAGMTAMMSRTSTAAIGSTSQATL